MILPLATGGHPGLDGTFSILDIGLDDPVKVVAVHGLVRSWFIDNLADVSYYERVHEVLASLALTKEDSRALVERIACDL
ncbi:Scr1 family TA system antitoxin-like transcriptional regulator [Actinomadura monticuli]|uniref:Scr1 family TA system antitoxin-like transcriptional regulator n=1 Tax=Actinomadura monticuli TaxID=3097367 RepID=A0ABV4Q2V1_9ACTN